MDRARLIDLVGEALGLPAAEREAFLTSRCDDPALLAEGLSLVAAEKTAGGFLDRPTVHGLASAPGAEGVGSSVGPYRLLELIGEGPAARVFMAEQRGGGGAARRVALRLRTSGGDASAAVARFLAARTALGSHPAIAALLDAGIAESGAAYFVSELVRGVAITIHAERVPEAARLGLVLAACDGVAHAHARRIVHGNLSPRNVLFAEVGGDVRVLDFGLSAPAGAAHPLAAELRDAVAGGEYRDPRGAADARTDVFALGVLVSRLLPDAAWHGVGARAADPDPARRFESAGALAEALRRARRPGASWLSRVLGR